MKALSELPGCCEKDENLSLLTFGSVHVVIVVVVVVIPTTDTTLAIV